MQGALRALRVLALALCAASASGCEDAATQLVVTVNTDYVVPEEMVEVAARVHSRTGEEDGPEISSHVFSLMSAGEMTEPGRFTVPFSFAVVPLGGDADRRVVIEVEGREAGTGIALVSRRAVTGFLPGATLALPMFLAKSCEGATCPPGETCTREGCRSELVPPEQLEPARPGEELDPFDGGPATADGRAGADGRTDSGTDAGADGALAACPSTCATGCEPVACDEGTSCDCHAEACNCILSCPSTGCETSCRRSTCVVRARASSLDATCGSNAECHIDARGAAATVQCESGSMCRVDCASASSCRVDCQPGADCLLRCTDSADCGFSQCPVAFTLCGDGWRACNAPCP